MNNINVLKKVVLKDRTLNSFKEKAEKLIKLEIIQAISAKHKPNEYKYNFKKRNSRGKQFRTTGTVFADRFSSLKKEDREKVYAELTSKQFADTDLKNESLSIKVDLKSEKSVLEQLDLSKEFSFMTTNSINNGTLDALLGTKTSGSATATKASSGVTATEASSGVTATRAKNITKLEFNLNEVKCIDATDPEKTLWVTNYDEISMGGVTVSDKGEEKQISEFSVSKEFKDGTIKTYDPKTLRTFTPDTDYSENKIFLVILFMAEKDSSGFSDFLEAAYNAIKDDLEVIFAALGVAAAALVGAEIGGTIGTAIVPALGTVIGILVGLIFGALIGWIIKALKDDVFVPSDEHQSLIVIPSSTSDFDGSDSLSDYMYFEDFDGKYRVKYTWQLYKS